MNWMINMRWILSKGRLPIHSTCVCGHVGGICCKCEGGIKQCGQVFIYLGSSTHFQPATTWYSLLPGRSWNINTPSFLPSISRNTDNLSPNLKSSHSLSATQCQTSMLSFITYQNQPLYPISSVTNLLIISFLLMYERHHSSHYLLEEA